MAFTIANVAMAGLFLFAAALQYNDPDPALWILVYAVAALLCVGALSGRQPWQAPAALGVVTGLWGLAHWFTGTGAGVGMELGPRAFGLDDEVAREALGLWAIASWMAIVAWRDRRAPAA